MRLAVKKAFLRFAGNSRGRMLGYSEKIIGVAKENAAQGVSPSFFESRSVNDIRLEDAADLLVCCEVLEHLGNPSDALKVLQSLTPKFVIFRVLRELLWRILNVMCRKYIGAWSNSPGHIQHWTRKDLLNLLQSFFSIVEVRTSLPWTMVLCSLKNAGE
jgi:2-polyprenyl-3-methyl-5-hydroxy-6-metoxy-1,4-benzoquinol methylase